VSLERLSRSDFQLDNPHGYSSPYDRAAQVWAARFAAAREEAMNWRLAVIGLTSVPALLSLAIGLSVGRASVLRYVTEVAGPREVPTANLTTEPDRISRTQIDFSLDQSMKSNSPLIDLVTMRERWLDVYDYVDDRDAEAFNTAAGTGPSVAKPFNSVRHRRGHPWHRRSGRHPR
jgi:type IV secretory pathway TrbF-like protein